MEKAPELTGLLSNDTSMILLGSWRGSLLILFYERNNLLSDKHATQKYIQKKYCSDSPPPQSGWSWGWVQWVRWDSPHPQSSWWGCWLYWSHTMMRYKLSILRCFSFWMPSIIIILLLCRSNTSNLLRCSRLVIFCRLFLGRRRTLSSVTYLDVNVGIWLLESIYVLDLVVIEIQVEQVGQGYQILNLDDLVVLVGEDLELLLSLQQGHMSQVQVVQVHLLEVGNALTGSPVAHPDALYLWQLRKDDVAIILHSPQRPILDQVAIPTHLNHTNTYLSSFSTSRMSWNSCELCMNWNSVSVFCCFCTLPLLFMSGSWVFAFTLFGRLLANTELYETVLCVKPSSNNELLITSDVRGRFVAIIAYCFIGESDCLM